MRLSLWKRCFQHFSQTYWHTWSFIVNSCLRIVFKVKNFFKVNFILLLTLCSIQCFVNSFLFFLWSILLNVNWWQYFDYYLLLSTLKLMGVPYHLKYDRLSTRLQTFGLCSWLISRWCAVIIWWIMTGSGSKTNQNSSPWAMFINRVRILFLKFYYVLDEELVKVAWTHRIRIKVAQFNTIILSL